MQPTFSVLTDWTCLRCEGEDAKSFLQGQLTCQMEEITETHPSLGAICNHQGRVLAIFWIFLRGNAYFLMLPSDIAHSTLVELKKFQLAARLQLSLDDSLAIVGITPTTFKDTRSTQATLMALPNANHGLMAIPTPLLPSFSNDLVKQGYFNQEASAFFALKDIQIGIPRIHPQTVGIFTPHDLNLQILGAVSFKKGCYRGQEIVARMEYLGKLKQQMVRMQFPEEITPGDTLFDEKQQPMGQVVTLVKIQDICEGLALIKNSVLDGELCLASGEKLINLSN